MKIMKYQVPFEFDGVKLGRSQGSISRAAGGGIYVFESEESLITLQAKQDDDPRFLGDRIFDFIKSKKAYAKAKISKIDIGSIKLNA